eukprot:TRINITY_DN5787_c0_g1_i4.p1 TRINITY_DN5787_c0_g1~~TRINITY_DN5787_c0_g1_i4.p1  ORF type:complete len:2428 (-),score=281.98 TRINITY_DN5787_c0_g1_i4:66-7349(-)
MRSRRSLKRFDNTSHYLVGVSILLIGALASDESIWANNYFNGNAFDTTKMGEQPVDRGVADKERTKTEKSDLNPMLSKWILGVPPDAIHSEVTAREGLTVVRSDYVAQSGNDADVYTDSASSAADGDLPPSDVACADCGANTDGTSDSSDDTSVSTAGGAVPVQISVGASSVGAVTGSVNVVPSVSISTKVVGTITPPSAPNVLSHIPVAIDTAPKVFVRSKSFDVVDTQKTVIDGSEPPTIVGAVVGFVAPPQIVSPDTNSGLGSIPVHISGGDDNSGFVAPPSGMDFSNALPVSPLPNDVAGGSFPSGQPPADVLGDGTEPTNIGGDPAAEVAAQDIAGSKSNVADSPAKPNTEPTEIVRKRTAPDDAIGNKEAVHSTTKIPTHPEDRSERPTPKPTVPVDPSSDNAVDVPSSGFILDGLTADRDHVALKVPSSPVAGEHFETNSSEPTFFGRATPHVSWCVQFVNRNGEEVFQSKIETSTGYWSLDKYDGKPIKPGDYDFKACQCGKNCAGDSNMTWWVHVFSSSAMPITPGQNGPTTPGQENTKTDGPDVPIAEFFLDDLKTDPDHIASHVPQTDKVDAHFETNSPEPTFNGRATPHVSWCVKFVSKHGGEIFETNIETTSGHWSLAQYDGKPIEPGDYDFKACRCGENCADNPNMTWLVRILDDSATPDQDDPQEPVSGFVFDGLKTDPDHSAFKVHETKAVDEHFQTNSADPIFYGRATPHVKWCVQFINKLGGQVFETKIETPSGQWALETYDGKPIQPGDYDFSACKCGEKCKGDDNMTWWVHATEDFNIDDDVTKEVEHVYTWEPMKLRTLKRLALEPELYGTFEVITLSLNWTAMLAASLVGLALLLRAPPGTLGLVPFDYLPVGSATFDQLKLREVNVDEVKAELKQHFVDAGMSVAHTTSLEILCTSGENDALNVTIKAPEEAGEKFQEFAAGNAVILMGCEGIVHENALVTDTRTVVSFPDLHLASINEDAFMEELKSAMANAGVSEEVQDTSLHFSLREEFDESLVAQISGTAAGLQELEKHLANSSMTVMGCAATVKTEPFFADSMVVARFEDLDLGNIDPMDFKQELLESYVNLGATQEALDTLNIQLRPGSVIAETRVIKDEYAGFKSLCVGCPVTVMGCTTTFTEESAKQHGFRTPLGRFLHGPGLGKWVFDFFWLGVATLNLFFWVCCTELSYQSHTTHDNRGTMLRKLQPETKIWFFDTHDILEICTLPTWIVLHLFRIYAAADHPLWRKASPLKARLRYFLFDTFAIIDLLVIVSLVYDIQQPFSHPDGTYLRMNCVWMSYARVIDILGRRGLGITFDGWLEEYYSERSMLFAILAVCFVFWIWNSCLYFAVNAGSESANWSSTMVTTASHEQVAWNRFRSLPASMFFCFTNLVKEHPLAYVHTRFLSRLVVMLTSLFGTPLFAILTGSLGATLLRICFRELAREQAANKPADDGEYYYGEGEGGEEEEAEVDEVVEPNEEGAIVSAGNAEEGEEEEKVEEEEDKEEVYQDTGWRGVLDALVKNAKRNCFIVLLSVNTLMLFYFTANRALEEGEQTPRLVVIPMKINGWTFAIFDAVVGIIFGVCWVQGFAQEEQGGMEYATSALGMIDFVSAFFGPLHLALFAYSQTAGADDDFSEKSWFQWLRAICIVRILKLEEFFHSFSVMQYVLQAYRKVFVSTLTLTFVMWIYMSAALYTTEVMSPDPETRTAFGSMFRSLWATLLQLHGEIIWADLSPKGKGITVVTSFFLVSIWCVPFTCMSGGYLVRIYTGFKATERDWDIDEILKEGAWQIRYRPTGGFRRKMFDILYCPYIKKEERRQLPPEIGRYHSLVKAMSFILTGSMVFVTVIGSLKSLHPSTCDANFYCRLVLEVCYTVDAVSAVFFVIEYLMRCTALGTAHVFSSFGLQELVSTATVIMSLIPSQRTKMLHPDYRRTKSTWITIEHFALPFRLQRTGCLNSYFKDHHLVWSVLKANGHKIFRALYAVLAVWFFEATLLYLTENTDEERDWQADRYNGKGIAMSQRYKDILSALPYALIHMSGDFPIYAYRASSQFILFLGFVFGMGAIAAFSGIFSAAFVSIVTAEKAFSVADRKMKRMLAFTFVCLKLQMAYRRKKHLREIGALPPFDPNQRSEPRVVPFSLKLRMIVDRLTKDGVIIMDIISFLVVVDVCNSILWTIPEVEMIPYAIPVHRTLSFLCDIVFIIEYMMRILSRWPHPFWYMLKFWRLVDLTCLIPGMLRMSFYWSVIKNASSGDVDAPTRLGTLAEIALVLRSLRILEFPFFQNEAKQIALHLKDTADYLALPSLTALLVWLQISAFFMWAENYYDGPARPQMATLCDTMYFTSMFVVGEWPMADFSPRVGSYCVIVTVLYGVMVFTIPFGLMIESVSSAFIYCNAQETRAKVEHVRWQAQDNQTNADTAHDDVQLTH